MKAFKIIYTLFSFLSLFHISEMQAQKIGIIIGTRTTLLKSLPTPTPQALFANYLASTAIYGTFKTTIGYEVGLTSLFQFKKVHFMPKLNYGLNTCDLIQTNYSNMTDYSPLRLRNHVIELHCLLRDNISNRIFIILGPSTQVRIAGSEGEGKDKSTIKIPNRNMIAYGIEGGVGVSIANNIDIQLVNQYSRSIFTTGALTKPGHTAALTLTYWTGYRQIN